MNQHMQLPHRWIGRLILFLWVMALASACAPIPEPKPVAPPAAVPPVLQRVAGDDLPRFADQLAPGLLVRSIEKSLAYYGIQPPERVVPFGTDTYSVAHIIHSLETFRDFMAQRPTEEDLNQWIRARCVVYRSTGRLTDGRVLFTGYYEPLIKGSLKATPRYRVPAHSRPSDLVAIDLSPFGDDLRGRTIVGRYTGRTVVPYPTRAQIRSTPAFNAIAPPVAWLETEFDLFNLQVQGSGRLQLDNGDWVHLLYNGTNDRPYRSIGQLLIDRDVIPRQKLTLPAIRQYLENNPDQVEDILNHNPRYVFFETATDGPMGAMGRQPLTPLRSIAIDRTIFPLGALAYIETPLARVAPDGRIESWDTHRGFALAQDTGGAIKGPGRVDVFMGHGIVAETAAGHLKHTGDLFFLVLKPAPAAP